MAFSSATMAIWTIKFRNRRISPSFWATQAQSYKSPTTTARPPQPSVNRISQSESSSCPNSPKAMSKIISTSEIYHKKILPIIKVPNPTLAVPFPLKASSARNIRLKMKQLRITKWYCKSLRDLSICTQKKSFIEMSSFTTLSSIKINPAKLSTTASPKRPACSSPSVNTPKILHKTHLLSNQMNSSAQVLAQGFTVHPNK